MIVQNWPKRKPETGIGRGICLVICGLVLIYGFWAFSRVVSGHRQTVQLVHGGQNVPQGQPSETERAGEVETPQGAFVASKKGKYYYPISCNKAKTLSSKNTLYFKDILTAEAAGYKPFSGC